MDRTSPCIQRMAARFKRPDLRLPGMSYELIEEHGGLQWPFAEGAKPSVTRLYEGGVFPSETGKAKLFAIVWKPFPDQPNTDFPMVFNTGRTVEHWHTRTK